MAKNVLPVDFQDDILTEDMDGRRKYQMITNADGTVSFVDVTEYTQVGSNFGQAQINATNEAVNESADKNKIIDTKADLMANTQAGMIAGALAVKEAVSELNENSTDVKNPIEGVWYIKNGRNVTVTIKRNLTNDFNLQIPAPINWFFVILRNETTGKPVQLWINGTNTNSFNAVNFVEGDSYSGTFSYISQS